MTTEERCDNYLKWRAALSSLEELEAKSRAAEKAGDLAFYGANRNATTLEQKEAAYDIADEHWALVDELKPQIDSLDEEVKKYHKLLKDNQFNLNDYYSQPGYGCTERKKVKVTLLDGTEMTGIIYPYVYDNADHMYLFREGDYSHDYDLDRGWEVKSVEFVDGLDKNEDKND